MDQSRKFLSWRPTGQDSDLASVAHAQRGSDALLELKLDALCEDEIDQPLPVLADIARDALGQFGKLLAFRLRDILSRDLRPARPDTVLRRMARMYSSMAVHGC
jgi:hypothetical protein